VKRIALVVSLIVLVAALAAGATNYLSVERPLAKVIADDPRNAGIRALAYHDLLITPSAIVLDIRSLSGETSAADVTRFLLQFAQAMKDRPFDRVILACQGRRKFILKGDYFHTLGVEFGTQNVVYTMRTLPENVFRLDGTAAFSTWTGGLLGVLGQQMEDLNAFHRQWYIDDLLARGGAGESAPAHKDDLEGL